MPEVDRKKCFIIDSMSIVHRSFHAFKNVPLRSSTGVPTAAVYGTALFISKLLNEQNPDCLFAVTDAGRNTFRHRLSEDYKATRQSTPSELIAQLPYIRRLFEGMSIPLISMDEYEADDLVSSLAMLAVDRDYDVFIVSKDKDYQQVVSDHIFLYVPQKGADAEIVGRSQVKENFGCEPRQFVDYLALIGDSSDNIEGVKGIGAKSAQKLIQQFGSIDQIYQRIDEVADARSRKHLQAGREAAYLARDLVTIKKDIPLDVNWDGCSNPRDSFLNSKELYQLFTELEFKLLVKQLRFSESESNQQSVIREVSVQDEESWQQLDADVKSSSDVALLLQVENESATELAWQICVTGDRFYTLTSNNPHWQEFWALVSDKRIRKVTHDLKAVWHRLDKAGLERGKNWRDTMIESYLVASDRGRHDLASAVDRLLRLPGDVVLNVTMILQIADLLSAQLSEQGLEGLLAEVEMPLIEVLQRMERRGVHLDADSLAQFLVKLKSMQQDLEGQIYQLAGREFKINSPKQLQEVLFDELAIDQQLGITKLKRTKTGISTDESVLSKLVGHPLPEKILEYRQVAKLSSTYVEPLPQFIDQDTGRIHANFRQTGTATGRLSCDSPNLQNIPMRTVLGQQIRKSFTAEPGNVLISADYSQVEIRLLAHLADEPYLIEAFANGLDIHRATAAKILGIPPDEVDKTQRSQAKAINFGIIYGMGPQRLAAETGLTIGEAKGFIAKYFAAYPKIKTYTRSLIQSALAKGYSETIMGRRRPIYDLADKNRAVAARAENVAVNSPIQGSAADLIKIAMINIQKEIDKTGMECSLILQVHDELVFECPSALAEAAQVMIKDKMEGAMDLKVPLQVDIGSGTSWYEAH